MKGDKPGNAAALVLVDVINAFDFEGCEALVEAAERAAPRILELKERAQRAGAAVIYANDNFGQWRSDFRATVAACSDTKQPGHRVTGLLAPGEHDYFVLKPRHSAFFCTPLELLLERLEVRVLVLVGFAANICVLFTANDAHMRGFDVWVPPDCTASNTERLTEQALEQMKLVAEARIEESTRIDWSRLTRPKPAGAEPGVASASAGDAGEGNDANTETIHNAQ
jgi:nicotinamidase-related amidase